MRDVESEREVEVGSGSVEESESERGEEVGATCQKREAGRELKGSGCKKGISNSTHNGSEIQTSRFQKLNVN
jgi:hypothetical protein